jgi:hypothetical protein
LQLEAARCVIDDIAVMADVGFDDLLRGFADPILRGLTAGDEPDGRD